MADKKDSPLARAKQVQSYVQPIRRAWKVYGIVVTIINLGFVGWLSHYDQASLIARISLLQSVILMTPLTLGVLLLARTYFLYQKASVRYIVASTLGTLGLCWLIGVGSGGDVAHAFLHPTTCFDITTVSGEIISSCTSDPGSGPLWFMFDWPSRLMKAYEQVYGVIGFLTGLTSGVFLGWTWAFLKRGSQ
ncbi:MAG: hypothetical protein QG608_3144 [Actinomycetota bacterium]|nr:hypothetical protein [Actinomycetota bacterium]